MDAETISVSLPSELADLTREHVANGTTPLTAIRSLSICRRSPVFGYSGCSAVAATGRQSFSSAEPPHGHACPLNISSLAQFVWQP